MDFEIVSKEEVTITGDREEMFSKLEQDIISQVWWDYVYKQNILKTLLFAG